MRGGRGRWGGGGGGGGRCGQGVPGGGDCALLEASIGVGDRSEGVCGE